MNWMRYKHWFFSISLLALVLASAPLALGKLQPSLEFTGGSRWVFATKQDTATVTAAVEAQSQLLQLDAQPVKARGDQEYEVVLPPISSEQKASLSAQLQTALQNDLTERSFTSVGPTLGRELITKTIMAILLGVITILVYLWWQFRDWRFGLAGVLAMLHDSLILTGAFGWLGWMLGVQIDTLFVTALLTTLSFSVHDTIVVFDRVRELKTTIRSQSAEWLASRAVDQTLTRSLNNSLTILFMLASLILLGGDSLRWFAVALFVGTLTGTYSSTFTALPLWVVLQRWRRA